MTIKQHLKTLNKKDQQTISSLKVRELECVDKGHWMGFVDDKEHSFDVSIFLKASTITDMTCDCDASKSSCLHKSAMVLAIDNTLSGQNKKTPVSNKKSPSLRLTPAQKLLQEKDKDLVYAWLVELFDKNKEVEQHFILHFQDKQAISYTTSSVEQIIDKTFTSVIGKRKTADATLIKSLVDMLELALEPVRNYIALKVYTKEAFELFHTIGEQVKRFKYSVSFTSKRTEKLVENIALFYAHSLLNLKDTSLVENALLVILEEVFQGYEQDRGIINLILLNKLLESPSKDYKDFLNKEIVLGLQKFGSQKHYFEPKQVMMLLNYFIKEELFKEHYTLFEPITYENKYNLTLIENLLALDKELAKKYALLCIKSNVKREYNVAYEIILKKIYEDSNDLEGQAHLALESFSAESHIDDYKLIQEFFGGTPEFKKFRSLTFSRLRNSFLYTPNACLLYFQILELDFDYKRMMELIDHKVDTEVVFLFAEDLMRFDKELFLEKVITAGEFGTFDITPSESLAQFIVDNYDNKYLRSELLFRTKSYNSLNKHIENKLVLKGSK
ncbi:hypothetical protein ACYSNM_11180 [Myroides sp. LJL116]